MSKKKLFITLGMVSIGAVLQIGVVRAADTTKLTNPLHTTDLRELVGIVISTGLTILGSLALVAFVVGGFMWLTSAGNQEKVKKGTQTMVWAAIGVLFVFASYAVLNTVFSTITGKETQYTETQAEETQSYFIVKNTSDGFLSLRDDPADPSVPHKDAVELFQISSGQCVIWIGEEDQKWYKVEYFYEKQLGQFETYSGWVNSVYLTKTNTKCAGVIK